MPNHKYKRGQKKNRGKNMSNKKKIQTQNKKLKLNDIIDDCNCNKVSKCGCRGNSQNNQNNQDKYRVNYVPNLINSTDKLQKNLVMKNTMPLISRLYQSINPITDKAEESKYLSPSSYGGPPGPACNWRKCSNKGGCGSECVCHPAGKYGWRCIPKCCIGVGGYPPCKSIYKYDVTCTLPCSGWPGQCQENFWNPYHTYQGPNEYPSGQPNLYPLY